MNTTIPIGQQDVYQPFPNVLLRNELQRLLEVPLFIKALGLPRGARILEVGCGRGLALAPLARHCAPSRLVGMDIDPVLADEARNRVLADATPADVVVADVRSIPFPDKSFDVVVDFGTCYHVARSGEALLEISRVLDDGAIFATETPVAQAVAHPMRTSWQVLPWESAPTFRLRRDAVLWAAWERRKAAGLGDQLGRTR